MRCSSCNQPSQKPQDRERNDEAGGSNTSLKMCLSKNAEITMVRRHFPASFWVSIVCLMNEGANNNRPGRSTRANVPGMDENVDQVRSLWRAGRATLPAPTCPSTIQPASVGILSTGQAARLRFHCDCNCRDPCGRLSMLAAAAIHDLRADLKLRVGIMGHCTLSHRREFHPQLNSC